MTGSRLIAKRCLQGVPSQKGINREFILARHKKIRKCTLEGVATIFYLLCNRINGKMFNFLSFVSYLLSGDVFLLLVKYIYLNSSAYFV